MSNKHDNIYNILGKLDALTPKQAPVEQTPAKTINESVEARGSVLEGVAKVEARLAKMFDQQVDEAVKIYHGGPTAHDLSRNVKDPSNPTAVAHRKSAADAARAARSAGDLKFRNPDSEITRIATTDRGDVQAIRTEQDMEEATTNAAGQRRLRDAMKAVQEDGPEMLAYFAIAAMYGNNMWDNDAMGDLVYDLEQTNPTEDELKYIIVNKTLPARLKSTRFTNTDDVQFGHMKEESDWSNLGAEYRSTKPGTKEPTHTGEKEYTKGGVKHTRDFDREVSHTAATGEKRGRGRPKKSQFEGEEENPGHSSEQRGQQQDDDFAKHHFAQARNQRRLDKEEEWAKSKGKSMSESINFAEMMKEQHQTVDEYLAELNADIATFKKSGHMSEKLRDSLEMHKFSKRQLNDAEKKPDLPVAVVAPAPKPPGMMQRAGSAIAHGVKSVAGAVNRAVGHPGDAEMLDRLKRDTMKEELDELARLAGISESLKGGQKKLDKNKNGKLDSDDFKRLRDKVDEAAVDEDMIKAKKDYDGDGKVETGSEEHAGSVDKAIKKAQAKKDLGEETHGQYLAQKEKEAQSSGKKSFQAFKQTHPVDGKPGVEEENEESLEEAKLPMKTVNGKKVPAFAADGKGKNDLQKEKVDECGPEMSPFSSMGHDEPESGMSINSSMDTKTGRKTLSVTADGEAAEELAQMLKMAGMGGQSREPKAVVVSTGPEEAVEEEREGQYANTPDEEVENIDSIMHQGNDLNREKEQYADKPKAGDNPMATRESIEMPRSLSKMLEAIKMVEEGKCNHTAKGEKCPVHGMKECSGMYEGKDEFGKGKNFAKIAKAAGGGEKGNRIAGAVRAEKIKKAGGVKYAK